MDTVIQVILAAIGLGFLVFIHELGHYLVALRVGMDVEVFSIGFGRPIYSWMRGKVKWQIGWLPFGGYVKIAGMELGKDEKTDSPGGFFTKKPWDRLKVAIAGPLANLILAFVIFLAIWAFGGREKTFAEFTDRLGWLDTKSELFKQGVRPGDILTKYNDRPYEEYKDLVYAAMFSKDPVLLEGYKINESTFEEVPFQYQIKPYPLAGGMDGFYTLGVLNPAKYMVYDKLSDGTPNPLVPSSPMEGSGLEYGDRFVWVNGDPVYSLEQMSHLINQQKTLLTIERAGKTLLVRVPRVMISELKLNSSEKEELSDWQYFSGLRGRFSSLYFIPYGLSPDLVVENVLPFIDSELQAQVFEKLSAVDQPLQLGDKIVAIDTMPVHQAADFLSIIQKPHATIIVQKGFVQNNPLWNEADKDFNQTDFIKRLSVMASTIGTSSQVSKEGDLALLKPVVPKSLDNFTLTEVEKAAIGEQKKRIEAISDPHKRSMLMRLFEEGQKKLLLGISLQDEKVVYNPGPFTLFGNVISETWHTLIALFSGELNPKFLSGPIGIVQVIQHGWSIGIKEALYWVAAISINLGVLNLLPIPVLDGGYIILSLLEMITRRKIKPKILEKIILPFVIVLISFLIFVTYYDITRLF